MTFIHGGTTENGEQDVMVRRCQEITVGNHCGGETFQSIFSGIG